MGEKLRTAEFSREDEVRFQRRLRRETRWLAGWLADHPDEPCPTVGGVELEAWLVDAEGHPVPKNRSFLDAMNDPGIVSEIGAYNVEFNGPPEVLTGRAVARLHHHLRGAWQRATEEARRQDCEMLMIGMLPSLREDHLHLDQMTDQLRYRALNDRVLELRRGEPLQISIEGERSLAMKFDSVMPEAALTSFQVHLQTRQSEMVRIYNAATIAAAPLVAATCNSPYIFDRPVWQESRIPVFEQVFQTRSGPPRVSLGTGYLRHSLFELLERNARLHTPLLPQIYDEPVEALHHVRLHNGSIWRWVRPVIDPNGGRPLLRIEHRVIPAGPTVEDCMANAVLTWGLLLWLGRRAERPEAILPFTVAQRNFQLAARWGLRSRLRWLDGNYHPVTDILSHHLPEIRSALHALDLDRADVARWLGIIERRLALQQTGARWQRRWAEETGEAGAALTRAYLANQLTGRPVHEWRVH